MTERSKFSSGVLWAYLQTFAARGITTLTFLFAGLIISPAEFGLYALVAGLLAISEMICEQAISQIIIQLQIKDNSTLSLIFFIGIAFGAIISLVLAALAINIEILFSAPEARQLLLSAAVCPLLISTTIVPIGIIRRDLNFKLLTKRTILASGVSSVIGLALVYFGYGAKGLVAQAILYYFIGAIILWLNCTWRPTTKFTFTDFKKIKNLGLKNANGKILDFAETRGIELIIGAFAGVHALGIYAFASKVVQTAFQILVSPIIEVIFSGAARGQSEIEKSLKTGQIFISIIPIAGLLFLAAASNPLLTLMYGNRWEDAAIPLTTLALAYAIRSYLYSYGVVLQATNHAGISILISTGRVLITIAIAMLFLIWLELPIFVATAYLLSALIIFPVQIYTAKQRLKISTQELLSILKNTFFSAIAGLIPLLIAHGIVSDSNDRNWIFLFISAMSSIIFTSTNLKLNMPMILLEFKSSTNPNRSIVEKIVRIFSKKIR